MTTHKEKLTCSIRFKGKQYNLVAKDVNHGVGFHWWNVAEEVGLTPAQQQDFYAYLQKRGGVVLDVDQNAKVQGLAKHIEETLAAAFPGK